MHKRNDEFIDNHVLQNQFTSFLMIAISNARIDYLRSRIRRLQKELVTEEEVYFANETDYIELLVDNDALDKAMREIKEKERYIVIARVMDEKGFEEIARELGMGYKGVAAIYYRAIKKLNKMLVGDDK